MSRCVEVFNLLLVVCKYLVLRTQCLKWWLKMSCSFGVLWKVSWFESFDKV
ncbi:hypothetical protein HanXRQr2_Chr14g0629901 [Helianthus annuus]|uniref:Uncharacterized protein n=1 Tax=Helianthus annuus TaxID=4232 RepID=A0A9K3E6H7_HELAN|nr:hypothetical protein HanXRQr2_Chr14g0629901 [Helianthus annuus]KAJ0463319.1 hypothetical protein HanHA300_Chr14g0514291 [Helianthus annuus]KAJ0484703.1 hypothetical protein HanHA89_Chr14g0559831 [Helianthus annuus]KAJ0655260.1 hypothetical protein HanLR1_Chr14g0522181 [Helianthus annuus]KAJ0839204.1 hypothetical protein HanPSC8_Chr14g0604131 [Helianthus annuus]